MAQYIQLPSDSEGNTSNSDFTTQLEIPLDIPEGKWEVGLVEFQFPNSWKNVDIGRIYYNKRTSSNENEESENSSYISIRQGRYTSFEELLAEMKKNLKVSRVGMYVSIFHDEVSNSSYIRIESELYKYKLSKDLAFILGFDPEIFYTHGTHESIRSPDLARGFSALYIYCDIIEHSHVGNVRTAFLRHVPVPHSNTKFEVIHKEFVNVHYYPLAPFARKTSTIQIFIRRDDGTSPAFTSGKVIAKIHIRPLQQ